MGTGQFPSADAAADEVTDMALIGGPRIDLATQASNTDFYRVEKVDANAIRFGGPGADDCPK